MKSENLNIAPPKAVGPYRPAAEAGGLIFVSGQIPLNSAGELVDGSISESTHQVLKNLAAVLKSVGSGLDKVVKATIYLTDMQDFEAVNTVYASYFDEPYPARACVQVAALPKGVRVEIEAIAAR